MPWVWLQLGLPRYSEDSEMCFCFRKTRDTEMTMKSRTHSTVMASVCEMIGADEYEVEDEAGIRGV